MGFIAPWGKFAMDLGALPDGGALLEIRDPNGKVLVHLPNP
jgi:hypothetical protein